VRRELKKKAKKKTVTGSEVLRSALEYTVKKRRLEVLEDKLAESVDALSKTDVEEVIMGIRENRQKK
jgi:hypothetical protein